MSYVRVYDPATRNEYSLNEARVESFAAEFKSGALVLLDQPAGDQRAPKHRASLADNVANSPRKKATKKAAPPRRPQAPAAPAVEDTTPQPGPDVADPEKE